MRSMTAPPPQRCWPLSAQFGGIATLQAAAPPSTTFPLPFFLPVHVCLPRSDHAPAVLLSPPRACLLSEYRRVRSSPHSARDAPPEAGVARGEKEGIVTHSTYPPVVSPPLSLPPLPFTL